MLTIASVVGVNRHSMTVAVQLPLKVSPDERDAFALIASICRGEAPWAAALGNSGETIAQTAQRTEVVYQMARGIHPEILLVGHGAAMESPEDAQYMLDHTSGDGFWTGSSTERLPIERAVSQAAAAFTSLRFSNRG